MKGRASFLYLLSLESFYSTTVEQSSLFPLSMFLFIHNILILTLQHWEVSRVLKVVETGQLSKSIQRNQGEKEPQKGTGKLSKWAYHQEN